VMFEANEARHVIIMAEVAQEWEECNEKLRSLGPFHLVG
jgi:hypothetical protein